MSQQGFGRRGGAARVMPRPKPQEATPEQSLDEEFAALMDAAREGLNKVPKRRDASLETPTRERKPFKIELKAEYYFYLAAVAIWLLGLYWLFTRPGTPNVFQLALTQLPVAGVIIAAQFVKKKA